MDVVFKDKVICLGIERLFIFFMVEEFIFMDFYGSFFEDVDIVDIFLVVNFYNVYFECRVNLFEGWV